MDSAEDRNCFVKMLIIFFSPFKTSRRTVVELVFPLEWRPGEKIRIVFLCVLSNRRARSPALTSYLGKFDIAVGTVQIIFTCSMVSLAVTCCHCQN